MSTDPLARPSEEIRTLLRERLRIKGPTLAAQIRKAGRLLPRAIRHDAGIVIEAHRLLAHPKLSRQIDATAARGAAERVVAHLKTIDPRDRMIGRTLEILGSIAAALIVVFIAVVWYLRVNGYV